MVNYTVAEAMQDRFCPSATPRSAAYRRGFEEKLRFKIENKPLEPQPYKVGTPEADAYFSGLDHAAEYFNARKDGPLYE